MTLIFRPLVGVEMVLRKTLDPYLIYGSDPSKGLEIMRCSNKVPKSVTHDVTCRWTDSSCYSIQIDLQI